MGINVTSSPIFSYAPTQAQEIYCHTDDSSGENKATERKGREREGRKAGTILITPNFGKQSVVFIIVIDQKIDSAAV